MSEYQYYEFRAVDRSLTAAEIEKLGELSSRANVTSNSFSVTYNYGDFRGEPERLMERYFDAFVYVTNWGSRRFMLRLPKRGIDLARIKPYANEQLTFWLKNEFVILSFQYNNEGGGDWEEGEGWLTSLIAIRDELLNGDFRSLYLGWLSGVFIYDADDGINADDNEDLEPPVPAGLRTLTAAQDELASFLEMDPVLIEAVAECSPALPPIKSLEEQLAKWIKSIPVDKKDQWLLELVGNTGLAVRAELLLEFRESQLKTKSAGEDPAGRLRRRTIGELRTAREAHVAVYEKRQAAKAAAKKTQDAKLAAKKREKELDTLSKRIDAAWQEIDQRLVSTSSNRFVHSLKDLNDLRELAVREGSLDDFRTRLKKLLHKHADKTTFLDRVKKAMLDR
ncbi:MAG: hypothetical protein JWM11_2397 [Planctomycetaceae bacterium]|nr:hypothetical protein [Planctomycetaceae bacterium]